MKAEFSYHSEYFDIALEHYNEIKILQKELDEITRKSKEAGKSSSDEIVDLIARKNDRIGYLALIVVVFSALWIEAFINDYAIGRLSKNYFKKYLDKLDVLSKWIVIPRITTGTQLDPGSKALQDLDWLTELRNKLVHYKSKKIEVEQIQTTDFLWESDAKRAIETVINLALELNNIDAQVYVGWVENEHKSIWLAYFLAKQRDLALH